MFYIDKKSNFHNDFGLAWKVTPKANTSSIWSNLFVFQSSNSLFNISFCRDKGLFELVDVHSATNEFNGDLVNIGPFLIIPLILMGCPWSIEVRFWLYLDLVVIFIIIAIIISIAITTIIAGVFLIAIINLANLIVLIVSSLLNCLFDPGFWIGPI